MSDMKELVAEASEILRNDGGSTELAGWCSDKISEEAMRISEANEVLRVKARYWDEARHIIDQPSVPRTYSEDICVLRDAVSVHNRLRSENERLLKLLASIEWNGRDWDESTKRIVPCCPNCWQWEEHDDDCELNAALRGGAS